MGLRMVKSFSDAVSFGSNKGYEPLFDGGHAFDLGVVLLHRGEPDGGGHAELVGHIDGVEPAVKGVFGTTDAELEFRAVELPAGGSVGLDWLLCLDGETGVFGFALAELLELGFHVLCFGGFRLVFRQPVHLIHHLLAAFLKHLGRFKFLLGERILLFDLVGLRLEKPEQQEIDHEESRGAEEDQEFFFAGRHLVDAEMLRS